METDNNQSHDGSNSNSIKHSNKTKFSGERKKHIYRLNHKVNNVRTVHADVNGAFNQIRKIFKIFTYYKQIDLSYGLKGLKPQSLRKVLVKNKKTLEYKLYSLIFFSKLVQYKYKL